MVGYRTDTIALGGDQLTGVSTPFQSYAWISALLQTVGPWFDAELHVVIVKDRRTGEDLMLLPLVRRVRAVAVSRNSRLQRQ